MEIADPDLIAYLRHRLGQAPLEEAPSRIRRKALELNSPIPDFSRTFGKSTVTAYVGFIDLAGFSTAVHGKTPEQIAEYLEPFLRGLVEILRGRGALIDKTIGDEVMFVLPETEEDPYEVLLLGQIMGALHDFAFAVRPTYPFRIGLSYGGVRFFCIEGPGYSEWTTVGEVVHVAKRLHSLPELESPDPVVGAFGMRTSQQSVDSAIATMRQRLEIVAGFASRFDHQFVPSPAPLKGVGDVLYAILRPRPERVGVAGG